MLNRFVFIQTNESNIFVDESLAFRYIHFIAKKKCHIDHFKMTFSFEKNKDEENFDEYEKELEDVQEEIDDFYENESEEYEDDDFYLADSEKTSYVTAESVANGISDSVIQSYSAEDYREVLLDFSNFDTSGLQSFQILQIIFLKIKTKLNQEGFKNKKIYVINIGDKQLLDNIKHFIALTFLF